MKLCDEAHKKGEGEMSKSETTECANGQDFAKTVPAKWDKEADVVSNRVDTIRHIVTKDLFCCLKLSFQSFSDKGG